jgi:hypothetical protein
MQEIRWREYVHDRASTVTGGDVTAVRKLETMPGIVKCANAILAFERILMQIRFCCEVTPLKTKHQE